MRVLYLGPTNTQMFAFLKECGDDVIHTEESLGPEFLQAHPADFIISYGYRHILRNPVLDLFPNRAINLHISLLPWNRGADPNFWSFIDDTPKGVTVHYLDEGIDTGDIIDQAELTFTDDDTLQSSYEKLQHAMVTLFFRVWPSIRANDSRRSAQLPGGTLHRMADKRGLASVLQPLGWATPVQSLVHYKGETELSRSFLW